MWLSKFIYDDLKQKFDIEAALTITKGKWADGNEDAEERIGYFVTSDNDSNEVEIANSDSYICGVTIKDDTFLYPDASDPSYCVVQALGLCEVIDDGSLVAGDKCMPSDEGIAIKSSNNLGYRVVDRVDDNHVQIIVAPNNDMVQRIKDDMVKAKSIEITSDMWTSDETTGLSKATIEWIGLTNAARVDVNFDLESLEKAGSIKSVTDTGVDCFYIYSSEAIGETITGMAYRVVVSC